MMVLIPHAVLAIALLVLQVLDVVSTNAALKQPDVVEVGDSVLGLGNLAGWAQAQARWRRYWWLIKAPFLVVVPLIWTPVPILAEPALVLALLIFDAYFFRLVRQNFINAKPRYESAGRTCVPLK